MFEHYAWVVATVWTVIIAASLAWSILNKKQETVEAARIQAQTVLEKELIFRQWNAEHGGLYVPVTEKTKPSPLMSHVPERDIITPGGKKLTLMNPAYMIRQMQKLGEEEYGVFGHITSLNAIGAENAPDAWETKALEAFEEGMNEISSVETVEGKEYMRLMRSFITEDRCLKCHASQGYKEGDVRGGISVSIPMEPLQSIAGIPIRALGTGYATLWLMGLSGLFWATKRLRQRQSEQRRAEEALESAKSELEIRVKERTLELKNANQRLEQDIEKRKKAEDALKESERLAHLGEQALQRAHDELEIKVEERTNQLTKVNIRLQELDILKSMFIASVSHELRTPLNSILGFTHVILDGLAGKITEEQKKQLTIVQKSSRHLLSLINDVIDVSKIEAGKLSLSIERFNLGELLQEVKESFNVAVAENDLDLTLEAPGDLIISSDRQRTRQIMINLLSNAIKFTERGKVELRAVNRDGCVELSVKDTGIGIKKESMTKLFDAFSRIHDENRSDVEGTGLGLYISKKIAGLLTGQIRVESEFGKGSEFAITLPLKYEEAQK